MFSNAEADAANDRIFSSFLGTPHDLQATDYITAKLPPSTVTWNTLKDMAANKTAGMHRVLHLKVGLPVDLVRNIDTADGLTNGTPGYVRRFERTPGGSVFRVREP